MILLETERLALCRWEKTDRDALVRIAEQDHIGYWLPDWKNSDKWMDGWIDRAHRHYALDDPMKKFMSWAIVLRENNAVIGQINAGAFKDRELETGYFLDEACCGKGYMTEMVKAFVPYIMETYGQDHMVATVQPENLASRRVVEKAGFRYVETMDIKYDGQETALPFCYYWKDKEEK